MAICSADDVQARLKRVLAPDESDAAEAMIEDFQGELEGLLGRALEVRSFTEVRYEPAWTQEIGLRQSPVISIASVTVSGTLMDASSYMITQNGLTFIAAWPGIDLLTPAGEFPIVIVYTAGMDATRAVPARSAIVGRVCRALSRRIDQAEGISSVKVEDYTAVYIDEGFTEDEMKACSRLRRRVIV